MGDLLFNGSFPFVDLDAGGSIAGYVAAQRAAAAIAPADAKVIPGHGPLGDVADIYAAADMIEATLAMVVEAKQDGRLEQLTADGLGARWETWGRSFVNAVRWIENLVQDLARPPSNR